MNLNLKERERERENACVENINESVYEREEEDMNTKERVCLRHTN